MAVGQRETVEDLEARFRAAKDVVERSHCQVVWLLAKGHSTAEVAEIVALSPRWVRKLARRYEAEGAEGLGDRRRGNAGAKPLLSADDLEALRERLRTPPDDGGVWSGPKVARWIAARLGLVHVHPPRGWEALRKLRWSLQAPRPRNPQAAGPEEQAAFKKSSARWSPRSGRGPTSRSSSGRRTSTGSA
ncbi:MAG: helix-turn-helix domain-containing protein [Amaricoccus sp.]